MNEHVNAGGVFPVSPFTLLLYCWYTIYILITREIRVPCAVLRPVSVRRRFLRCPLFSFLAEVDINNTRHTATSFYYEKYNIATNESNVFIT